MFASTGLPTHDTPVLRRVVLALLLSPLLPGCGSSENNPGSMPAAAKKPEDDRPPLPSRGMEPTLEILSKQLTPEARALMKTNLELAINHLKRFVPESAPYYDVAYVQRLLVVRDIVRQGEELRKAYPNLAPVTEDTVAFTISGIQRDSRQLVGVMFIDERVLQNPVKTLEVLLHECNEVRRNAPPLLRGERPDESKAAHQRVFARTADQLKRIRDEWRKAGVGEPELAVLGDSIAEQEKRAK